MLLGLNTVIVSAGRADTAPLQLRSCIGRRRRGRRPLRQDPPRALRRVRAAARLAAVHGRGSRPTTSTTASPPAESLTRFRLGAVPLRRPHLLRGHGQLPGPRVRPAATATQPAADFLLNISNDGWFDGTAEHAQHLAICRFRAIEARRSVGRLGQHGHLGRDRSQRPRPGAADDRGDRRGAPVGAGARCGRPAGQPLAASSRRCRAC